MASGLASLRSFVKLKEQHVLDPHQCLSLLTQAGRCPVMVATDVAARGLDVPNVGVVVNFDFPNGVEVKNVCWNNYILHVNITECIMTS